MEEVEAEVIESGVDRIPGAQKLLARLRERAARVAADYSDMTEAGQLARPLAENKRLRASLNAEMKSMESDFKAAIRPYEDMIAESKSEFKSAIAEMRGAEALLRDVVARADGGRARHAPPGAAGDVP